MIRVHLPSLGGVYLLSFHTPPFFNTYLRLQFWRTGQYPPIRLPQSWGPGGELPQSWGPGGVSFLAIVFKGDVIGQVLQALDQSLYGLKRIFVFAGNSQRISLDLRLNLDTRGFDLLDK